MSEKQVNLSNEENFKNLAMTDLDFLSEQLLDTPDDLQQDVFLRSKYIDS